MGKVEPGKSVFGSKTWRREIYDIFSVDWNPGPPFNMALRVSSKCGSRESIFHRRETYVLMSLLISL